jgi:ribosomal protein L16 Arg81 hydroxylase
MYYDIDIIYDIKDADNYMNFQKPYMIKGGCKNMDIFNKKNKIEYLKDNLKSITLPVEIYDNDNEMGETNIKKRREISFDKIYNKIIDDKSEQKYYLAEIDLLDYISQLPEEFLNNFVIDLDEPRLNDGMLIFFGKNGKSGCHLHTSHDYVLNQISGTKTVYMFDYHDNNMEFHGLFSDRSNFTKSNFFTMDKTNMKIYKAVLEEGDSLMIPPWWWHAVEGNGLNYSITKTYDRNDHTYLFDKPYLILLMLIAGFFEILEGNYIIILSILLILLIFYTYLLTNDLSFSLASVL